MRADPVLYDLGIVFVCQGRKRGHFGDQIYLYDDQHYLPVFVPVPFTMETDASIEAPLLAIYMHLDFKLAADLMLQIGQYGGIEPAHPRGMMSTPMDRRLCESLLCLLEVMNPPLEVQILGPALVREIYFRVLAGEQGGFDASRTIDAWSVWQAPSTRSSGCKRSSRYLLRIQIRYLFHLIDALRALT